jgi:hypothetical protein
MFFDVFWISPRTDWDVDNDLQHQQAIWER